MLEDGVRHLDARRFQHGDDGAAADQAEHGAGLLRRPAAHRQADRARSRSSATGPARRRWPASSGPAGFAEHGIPTEGEAGGLSVKLVCKVGEGVLARLGRVDGQFTMVITRCSIFEPPADQLEARQLECGIPFWPHGFVTAHCDIDEMLEHWTNEYACLGYGEHLYDDLVDFCKHDRHRGDSAVGVRQSRSSVELRMRLMRHDLGAAMKEVLLKDFRPKCLLNVAAHVPQRARFPVIDAHNHLFGELPAEKLIEVMDAVGVRTWVNVTGNTTMPLVNNTYSIARRELGYFMEHYVRRYPGPVRRADDGRFRPVGRSGAAEGRRFRQAVHRAAWRPTWPPAPAG